MSTGKARPRVFVVLGASAAFLLALAPVASAGVHVPRASGTTTAAVPVVYDTDVDFDDSAALAYLAGEEHAGHIHLLAVTAEDDGAGLPVLSTAHLKCILGRSGLGAVPVAEGTTVLTTNIVPPEVRHAAEAVIEPRCLDACRGLSATTPSPCWPTRSCPARCR